MRPKSLWFRESEKAWYTTVQGKQVRLAKGRENRAEAERKFHALMLKAPDAPISGLAVEGLYAAFLASERLRLDDSTTEWYLRFLRASQGPLGRFRAEDLKPIQVTRWLDSKTEWSQTTKANAVTAIKRAFKWGVEQGLLDKSPLARLPKPRRTSRNDFPTVEQATKLLEAVPEADPFRLFVVALFESGARLDEVASVTAADFLPERRVWVLRKHKGDASGDDRRIRLSERLVEISRRLASENPSGPLFRNAKGGKWTRFWVGSQFRRWRKKLGFGPELHAHGFRHLFATDCAAKGLSEHVTCELLGHADSEMVRRVYAHLDTRDKEMGEWLDRVR